MKDSDETKQVANYVLFQALHLLAPFMPFITEELNEKVFKRTEHLTGAGWPMKTELACADTNIDIVVDIISEIRAIRSEMNVPLSAKPTLQIAGSDADKRTVLSSMAPAIMRMARLDSLEFMDGIFAKGTARTSLHGLEIGLPLDTILDFNEERARLDKEIAACEAEMKKLSAKLSNQGFLAKAPESVIEENKRRFAEEQQRSDGLTAARNRLDL